MCKVVLHLNFTNGSISIMDKFMFTLEEVFLNCVELIGMLVA